MRHSIPALLSFAIAALGVAGIVFVASATTAGTAPGNGQKVFDAPGCQPKSYAGPGRTGHYLLNRNCPRPTPVVLSGVARMGDGWRVTWDGSRSFDSIGGRLVSYVWTLEDGSQRRGPKIAVDYGRPGPHSVVLYVTDDAGLLGTARGTVQVP